MTDLALQLARIPMLILLGLAAFMFGAGLAWLNKLMTEGVVDGGRHHLVCAVCGGDDPDFYCADCETALCGSCCVYEKKDNDPLAHEKGPFCRDFDSCIARLEITREGDAA